MYELQTTVNIRGNEFHITNDGDYRMVLDCFKALNDEEMSEDLRVLASLLIFYNEFQSPQDIKAYDGILKELIQEMYTFFNCGQQESIGAKSDRPLIDWDGDSQMICAAVNNVANIEIRAIPYVHWWTFMGYFSSVGESTLSTVLTIRNKIIHHKKLEKYEKDFKKDNPEYFVWKSTTVQDHDMDQMIRELWNQGGE